MILFDDTHFDPHLCYLSLSCIQELVDKYYDGIYISELLKEFHIPFPPTELATIFPTVIDDQYVCKICHSHLSRRFLSRITSEKQLSEPFCNECEKANIIKTFFNDVPEIQAIENKTNQSIVNLCFKDNSLSKELLVKNTLSLKDIFFLLLLKQSAIRIDKNIVYGLNDNRKLTTFNDGKLFEKLIIKKIISLHKSTNNNALTIKNKKVVGLNLYKSNWKINLDSSLSYLYEIEQSPRYSALDSDFHEAFKDEINNFRLDIIVNECLEFLVAASAKIGFPVTGIKVQNQIKKALLKILSETSQAVCFQFIWSVCEITANFCKEVGLYNKNYSMINGLFLVRAKNHTLFYLGQDTQHYRFTRPIYCPQSKLNKLFFNDFLEFDDDSAFYQSPQEFLKQIGD